MSKKVYMLHLTDAKYTHVSKYVVGIFDNVEDLRNAILSEVDSDYIRLNGSLPSSNNFDVLTWNKHLEYGFIDDVELNTLFHNFA